MIFTEEKTTDFSFPNITVLKKFRNGELCAYIARADEGFSLYDRTENLYDIDSANGEEKRVIRYFKKVICPLSYDFGKFPWEAVNNENISDECIF